MSVFAKAIDEHFAKNVPFREWMYMKVCKYELILMKRSFAML